MGSWIQSRNEQTICAGQVADRVVSTAHILQLFKVSAHGGTAGDEPTSVRPERRADRVDGNCRAWASSCRGRPVNVPAITSTAPGWRALGLEPDKSAAGAGRIPWPPAKAGADVSQ